MDLKNINENVFPNPKRLKIGLENITLEKELQSELMIKSETLDENAVVKVERSENDTPEENCMKVERIENETSEENCSDENDLNTINYENLKLEKQSHSELIIKSETFNENVVMKVEQSENETPEEKCSDENDLNTINYENLKLEKQSHSELMIKSETLDENAVVKVERSENDTPEENFEQSENETPEEKCSDENDLNTINYENLKLEKQSHSELIIKSETFNENVVMKVEQSENETSEENCSDENDLNTINYENLKLEKQSHSELMIKSETLDENAVVKVERSENDTPEENCIEQSENETPEEKCSDENDLNTINYENLTIEIQLQSELMIKCENLDENAVMKVERIENETPEENCSDENDLNTINYENLKLEKELHTEVMIKDEIMIESDLVQQDENVNPFSCEICKKIFLNRYKLLRHKIVHSDTKSFSCDSCSKAFSRRDSLVRHKKIHSRVKPFSCDSCDKTFTQSCDLFRHKQHHNEQKLIPCDTYDADIKERSALLVKDKQTGDNMMTSEERMEENDSMNSITDILSTTNQMC
ncbi:zinc finger protein 675-like [Chrysoperla carnea]|uniref:zinc finger protein 675-like n=1 Tax=Chrysoperla carnea TaxID=189513 RepID=UPI001D083465|nr:zinc finger protein 675-like [Chrysoperla carnea]